MIGIITLIVALAAQIAFLVFRMRTKNWQTRWTHFTRIAAFTTFSLLLLTGVYQWGFRWMALLLLLGVLAVISSLYFVMKTKKEKQYKRSRAIFSCISGCLLLSFYILPGILFPQFKAVASTGSFRVASQSVTLDDVSRIELFSPSHESRKLSIQFWYPSAEGTTASFPLLVFSHGAFGFRGSNLSTFEDLASNGYVVCSIDHSYHSFFSKHTDGSVTPVNLDFLKDAVNITNGAFDEEMTYLKTHEWLTLRTADMNFVLDEILYNKSGKMPVDVSILINPDKIGLFGHSLGGATAAQLGRERTDIDAVAVIDGTMFGEELAFEDGNPTLNESAYPVPILNLYNQSHYEEAHQQVSAYPNLCASEHAAQAEDIVIRGSGHLNFTDLPLFSPVFAQMLGTGEVDSRYCIQTMNQIVLEFFDHTLKGTSSLSLQNEY